MKPEISDAGVDDSGPDAGEVDAGPPDSGEPTELTVIGTAASALGAPLSNTEVRLLRFVDQNDTPSMLIEPSVDDLFECDRDETCDLPALGLELELLDSVFTTAEGSFEFSLSRSLLAPSRPDGRESQVVVMIKDQSDPSGKAGAFTAGHFFLGEEAVWDAGSLNLWQPTGSVAENQLDQDVIDFSWTRIDAQGAPGPEVYRLEVQASGAPRLVLRCTTGVIEPNGGCSDAGSGRARISVSKFVLSRFISTGTTEAYVLGDAGANRFRAKIPTVANVPSPAGSAPGVIGMWAVGSGADQSLMNSLADDGDPATGEPIVNMATAIYVKFAPGTELSDVALFGARVRGAHGACISVSTNTSIFDTIQEAKTNTQGWTTRGTSCGGAGSDDVISAQAHFSPPQLTPWVRFVVAPSDAEHSLMSVAEVAALSPN